MADYSKAVIGEYAEIKRRMQEIGDERARRIADQPLEPAISDFGDTNKNVQDEYCG